MKEVKLESTKKALKEKRIIQVLGFIGDWGMCLIVPFYLGRSTLGMLVVLFKFLTSKGNG
jgi:hypothetical protein